MTGDTQIVTKHRTRWWVRVLRTVLLLYVVWVIGGCAMLRSVIFPRSMATPLEGAAETIRGLERLHIASDEGPVEAWFVRGDGVDAEHPGPAVMFAHGNAELIDYQLVMIEGYRRMGVSVMLCEFRGYGRSGGRPSQQHIHDDYMRAYELLGKRPDVDASRIVFHGRSIGTGVACDLARVHRPAAMILTSPMTSITAMAARDWLPSFCVSDPFDNLSVVKQLDGPLLIMHGKRDEVIPFEHGKTLAAAAKHGMFVEFNCGHNDVPIESREFWRAIETFLRTSGIVR